MTPMILDGSEHLAFVPGRCFPRTPQEARILLDGVFKPIRKKVNRSLALIAPLAAMAAALYGCGGGGTATGGTTGGTGGGTTGGGGGGTFALSGTVSMPGVGAAGGRDSSYVAVSGASVKLVKVEDGSEVATDTTDANGLYEFNGVETGVDYKVEATKTIDGKTYTIKAVVTIDDAATPETRDLDPLTTVAADAALEEYNAAKTADGSTKPVKLEDICKEIENTNRSGFVAPDLSDSTALENKKNEALNAVSPDGNYLGQFEGDGEGFLAAQIKDGKFWIIGMNKKEVASIESVVGQDNGSDPDNGDGGDGGDGGDTGDDTGGDTGGDETGPDSPFAIGTVDGHGVISAATNDGFLSITGIVIGNKGVGTWVDEDGNHGTWRMFRRTFDYAGLYIGTVADEAASDGGHFAVMVTNDKKVIVHGYSVSYDLRYLGVGTIDDNGAFSFRWRSNWGDSGTTTGTVTNDGMTGILLNGEEELPWSASRLFDPKDAFFE